jgi:hypothetical protein
MRPAYDLHSLDLVRVDAAEVEASPWQRDSDPVDQHEVVVGLPSTREERGQRAFPPGGLDLKAGYVLEDLGERTASPRPNFGLVERGHRSGQPRCGLPAQRRRDDCRLGERADLQSDIHGLGCSRRPDADHLGLEAGLEERDLDLLSLALDLEDEASVLRRTRSCVSGSGAGIDRDVRNDRTAGISDGAGDDDLSEGAGRQRRDEQEHGDSDTAWHEHAPILRFR